MTTVSIGGGLGLLSPKESCLNHRRSLLKTAIILLKYSNLVGCATLGQEILDAE